MLFSHSFNVQPQTVEKFSLKKKVQYSQIIIIILMVIFLLCTSAQHRCDRSSRIFRKFFTILIFRFLTHVLCSIHNLYMIIKVNISRRGNLSTAATAILLWQFHSLFVPEREKMKYCGGHCFWMWRSNGNIDATC